MIIVKQARPRLTSSSFNKDDHTHPQLQLHNSLRKHFCLLFVSVHKPHEGPWLNELRMNQQSQHIQAYRHTVPQADGGFFLVTSVPTMPKTLYDPEENDRPA